MLLDGHGRESWLNFHLLPCHTNLFFILKFTSTSMYRKGHLFSDQFLHDINLYKSPTNFSIYQSKWLIDTFFIYIKFSSILSDSSDSLKASWFDCFFLEQQIFFINIPRQNKQLRPIARAKVTEINPADTNRIKIIVNPGFASRTFRQSRVRNICFFSSRSLKTGEKILVLLSLYIFLPFCVN